tara:strand:- start:689 stop:1012 length:324 start_codon:yes stop_codon:yes gene_type:complete
MSDYSKYEIAILKKQQQREKKLDRKIKRARLRRQPPFNHVGHTGKRSFKPLIVGEVKQTRCYQDLTWELEKIENERQVIDEYNEYMFDLYIEEQQRRRHEEEEEENY